jgi:hypothetical protein
MRYSIPQDGTPQGDRTCAVTTCLRPRNGRAGNLALSFLCRVILCPIPGYRLCSPTAVEFASDFLHVNTPKVPLELMMGCLAAAQSSSSETGRRWGYGGDHRRRGRSLDDGCWADYAQCRAICRGVPAGPRTATVLQPSGETACKCRSCPPPQTEWISRCPQPPA